MTCHRRMYAIAALLGRIDSHEKNHSTEPVPNASRLKWEAISNDQFFQSLRRPLLGLQLCAFSVSVQRLRHLEQQVFTHEGFHHKTDSTGL